VADVLRVLGQVAPTAATLTTLYTAPGSATTGVTASSAVVCNRGAAAIRFRLSVAVAGAADSVAQYLYYDVALAANDSFVATIGITLAASDVVRCYTDLATVSFNLFGIESSP